MYFAHKAHLALFYKLTWHCLLRKKASKLNLRSQNILTLKFSMINLIVKMYSQWTLRVIPQIIQKTKNEFFENFGSVQAIIDCQAHIFTRKEAINYGQIATLWFLNHPVARASVWDTSTSRSKRIFFTGLSTLVYGPLNTFPLKKCVWGANVHHRHVHCAFNINKFSWYCWADTCMKGKSNSHKTTTRRTPRNTCCFMVLDQLMSESHKL